MPTRGEMHSLVQETIASYEARAARIEALGGEVAAQRQAAQAQLHDLDRDHQAMARKQRADLAKGRSNMAKGRSALAKSVATQLKELDAHHQAVARKQRADLAKGRSGLSKAEARRKSEVNAWMKEVATIHAEARDEWQTLAVTMQAKRGALAVAAKPPQAVVPPLVEEVPAEEAIAGVQASNLTPELADLRDRVFAYLADHADGTKMTELERVFGVARIKMARVLLNLLDEDKAEKRDLLYFAI